MLPLLAETLGRPLEGVVGDAELAVRVLAHRVDHVVVAQHQRVVVAHRDVAHLHVHLAERLRVSDSLAKINNTLFFLGRRFIL